MRVKINDLTVQQCQALVGPCGQILEALDRERMTIELNMARCERIVITREED